ncbi:MAG: prepilin-type N-terminal cleavage/methylation domain-containing protein [Deltaproteobacteria bacterium]|nr:prepilin-type N-terminal cleavage/methylation domain-containing protein [Deltaproteobacteria bacterium]
MLARLRESRGLTLVELMVVVAILGILATVAVVSYKRYIQRARLTEGIAFLMDIKMKQETHFATYSFYVDTAATLTDFWPVTAGFVGSHKEGLAFWDWDCTETSPPLAIEGFCRLGIYPTGEVYEGLETLGQATHFQYMTIGWEPGDPNPTQPWIHDPTRRWWFARARTFWDDSASEGMELRLSSETVQVGELGFP